MVDEAPLVKVCKRHIPWTIETSATATHCSFCGRALEIRRADEETNLWKRLWSAREIQKKSGGGGKERGTPN